MKAYTEARKQTNEIILTIIYVFIWPPYVTCPCGKKDTNIKTIDTVALTNEEISFEELQSMESERMAGKLGSSGK